MGSEDQRSAAAVTLGLYAGAHLAVDATCGVVLWKAVHDGLISTSTAWSAFVVYNLLAFAVQPLVGLAVDRLKMPRAAALTGAVITALAVPLAMLDGGFAAAVVAAGLGNAVFHVGGGVTAAAVAPGRATPLGLFVAPGAAGVAAGIAVGRAGGPAWPFVVAMLALTLAPLALSGPSDVAVAQTGVRRRAWSTAVSRVGARRRRCRRAGGAADPLRRRGALLSRLRAGLSVEGGHRSARRADRGGRRRQGGRRRDRRPVRLACGRRRRAARLVAAARPRDRVGGGRHRRHVHLQLHHAGDAGRRHRRPAAASGVRVRPHVPGALHRLRPPGLRLERSGIGGRGPRAGGRRGRRALARPGWTSPGEATRPRRRTAGRHEPGV